MNKYIFLVLILVCCSSISSAKEEYIVTSEKLNVRKCPSKNCGSIFKLNSGDLVDVLRKSKNNWCEISYKNITGFVYGKYLKKYTTENSGGIGLIRKDLLIKYWPISIPIVILLISLFLIEKALRNFGRLLVLLGSTFYFFIGLFLNFITNLYQGSFEGIIISLVAYILMFVVLIPSIISFFKNTGIAIILLGLIAFSLDIYTESYFGVLLIAPVIIGEFSLNIGSKQVINQK